MTSNPTLKKLPRADQFAETPIREVEAFWNTRPCNIRHSTKPIGSKEYFDEVERRKYFVEAHIPPFADFQRWKGKRVLEIGCGIGTDTISFARAGASVTAVDLSKVSLEIAQERARTFGLADRITFYHGDCESLASLVPPGTYDLVYSFGVIHHTPRPERALAQMRHFMDAQSDLRLMVYSKVSYKLFWIMQMEECWEMSRIDELIARNSEAQTGCPITYTYTRGELMRLLGDFEVLEARKAHIFMWDVQSYIRHQYERDRAWTNVSEGQIEELESELGWHWLARARLPQS